MKNPKIEVLAWACRSFWQNKSHFSNWKSLLAQNSLLAAGEQDVYVDIQEEATDSKLLLLKTIQINVFVTTSLSQQNFPKVGCHRLCDWPLCNLRIKLSSVDREYAFLQWENTLFSDLYLYKMLLFNAITIVFAITHPGRIAVVLGLFLPHPPTVIWSHHNRIVIYYVFDIYIGWNTK